MDYQSNSNKAKEQKDKPEKKIEKVVTGPVVVKPPSVGNKFKNIFFGGDFHTAAEYVAAQVLLPALRNLVVESFSKGVDRLVYGDSARPSRPTMGGYQPRVQYNNPLARQGAGGRTMPPNPPIWNPSSIGKKPFEDITVGTNEEAEAIVDAMSTIVNQYDIVSVADLYEVIGLPSSPIDNKWGWSNMASIQIHQNKDGWKITFPPVEEIA